jgi:hypothetical protein
MPEANGKWRTAFASSHCFALRGAPKGNCRYLGYANTRQTFPRKTIHREISPLRFAPVEMTKERAVFPRESSCSMGANLPTLKMTNCILEAATPLLRPIAEGRTVNFFYYASTWVSCRKTFQGKSSQDDKGEGGASRAERLLNDNLPSPPGWVAQVSPLRPGCSGRQFIARDEKLWRASPIVFGPRTLVRTWGTRVDLWDP